ncbi:hypothetical protein AK88_01788 [Plasmodium fragile]|uniref:Uncharacterized protein n=1 Tax=Plasmodium fragile TaxID=5857 RepID=A0A0D9QN75_PLAFR|nr:uncharacterized protein AK88_01788 [Plasmodium fragile]KJP88509.1 hypothetical protein AK88_01788 [Plasmodium fragile]
MRLLTHNFLKCNETQCDGGYPLSLVLNSDAEENMKIIEQEINVEFVKNVLTKVDYDVLYQTATQLGLNLPVSYTTQHLEDEEFLNSIHHALFKVPT